MYYDINTILVGVSMFVFILAAWKFFDFLNHRDIEGDDESE